jgi:hypothetical protein
MKSLVALLTLAGFAVAQTPAKSAKPEPTKSECHTAYAQNNALASAHGAWIVGGSKGTSPLSRYSITELDGIGDLMAHCSAVDSFKTSDGSNRLNDSFLDLMKFFQLQSHQRVLKYIFRHQLWVQVVKEDAAGLGRE